VHSSVGDIAEEWERLAGTTNHTIERLRSSSEEVSAVVSIITSNKIDFIP